MNINAKETLWWFDEWYKISPDVDYGSVQVIIAPSHTHLPLASNIVKTNLQIASQDVSLHEKGAHTGEAGAFQIKEFCKYSIVGHSERKETEKVVMEKIKRCFENQITPIVCFTKPKNALKYYKEGIILAWEDPSNISVNGKYREKNPKDIQEGVRKIRKHLPKNAKLIYGGSVNKENIGYLADFEKLGGVLVGNASLDPEHFLDLVKAYCK